MHQQAPKSHPDTSWIVGYPQLPAKEDIQDRQQSELGMTRTSCHVLHDRQVTDMITCNSLAAAKKVKMYAFPSQSIVPGPKAASSRADRVPTTDVSTRLRQSTKLLIHSSLSAGQGAQQCIDLHLPSPQQV